MGWGHRLSFEVLAILAAGTFLVGLVIAFVAVTWFAFFHSCTLPLIY